MPKRVAACLRDVGCVAVVLLRRPHDLRLRRPGESPWTSGGTATGAGAGARIAGGGACSHLSSPVRPVDSVLQYAIELQSSEGNFVFARLHWAGQAGPAGPLCQYVFVKTPALSTISCLNLICWAPHASVGLTCCSTRRGSTATARGTALCHSSVPASRDY